jgi:hypothetical protein
MSRLTPALLLPVLLLGAGWASMSAGGAAHRAVTDPEDGAIADGVYANRYFDLDYPLPPGWKAGLEAPLPSNSGYYVLSTPIPGGGGPKATMLIAAQDMFFAVKPMADATAMVADLYRNAQETAGLKADTAPRQVTIAGHSFARLDIGGTVLSRIVLATDIRCHVVSFTFASPDPQVLAGLAVSLDKVSLPPEASAAGSGSVGAGSSVPPCVENYATEETVLHKVAPLPIGPKFFKIPVRIIIDRDGKVKRVHVIRAFPGQAKSIEDALAQWQFKPYEVDGRPAEVETGLVFEFKPTDKDR